MNTAGPSFFRILVAPFALLLLLQANPVYAQEEQAAKTAEKALVDNSLSSLSSLAELQARLEADIRTMRRQLKTAQSEAERKTIQTQLDKLQADLDATQGNFEKIAAGTDIDSLRAREEKPFDFTDELFSLIKPAIKEMKEMTSSVRQKSELKDKINYYNERLPLAEQGVASIERLLKETDDKTVKAELRQLLDTWKKQQAFIQNELQAAQLQLDKLASAESSLAETSGNYLKSFFQKRGLYLTQALLFVAGVLVLSRLIYKGMERYIPGYNKRNRSFRIRLLDLLYRVFTIVLVITGPMVVFYLVEDWVLFSLGILLLIGIAWTLRQALPRYWRQVQVFLNIGSVREGERVTLDGLPWRVREINLFSMLENPVAELAQRVPIGDLIDMKSRPAKKDEPWFPCRQGDWVILSDGVRGKVIGIGQELVTLVQRGGAQKSYPMAEFLAQSPLNLATNFRIKETIGISYKLQQESTSTIPGILEQHVRTRIDDEGYGEQLVNLRVEFEAANASSLDLVVIADFKGELGDLYNRLRRAIQRWCVEACTLNHWEIPFQQVTLHQAPPQTGA